MMKMTSYEIVFAGKDIENTGVDCRYFATREEAEQAAEIISADFPESRPEVVESDRPADITFAEWNEQGWY